MVRRAICRSLSKRPDRHLRPQPCKGPLRDARSAGWGRSHVEETLLALGTKLISSLLTTNDF